jgi:organic radical activating enzyme
MKARIAEIFDSIQGEGIYLGEKQIFVRFFGCNLSCRFCDTKLNCFIEYEPEELFAEIKMYQDNYHSLSLTGGEPLLQVDFLERFLPKLKRRKIYLETNGTLAEELNRIIDMIDIIAVDIKLPSSTGERDFWHEHKRFLEVVSKKEVFIKTVICNSTELEDLKRAVNLIVNFNKDIPFILQPNSFELGERLIKKLIDFQNYCCDYLFSVRVIPQIQKILSIR